MKYGGVILGVLGIGLACLSMALGGGLFPINIITFIIAPIAIVMNYFLLIRG